MAARFTDHILTPGAHASLPDPALTPEGAIYPCTTHGKLYRNDGAAWQDWAQLGDPGTAAALSDHLADTADAHDASAVSFAPTGNLAATDVQAALAELDTEKAGAGHTHTAASVTYAGSANLAATDVEAALDELDAEKAPTGHTHALDDLTDVDLTGAAEGNALIKTATGWGPGTVAGGGGGGGGTFRGEWTATPLVVAWSDEFADGTEAPFTHTYSGGGVDYTQVMAYASVKGGAIPSPPANMIRIGKNSTVNGTATVQLTMAATGVADPRAVRFWWAQENSGGILRFIRNGVEVVNVSNIPWTQRTETVGAGDTIQWQNQIPADPYPNSYLTRVEVLAPDPAAAPYMAGEFVTHLGKLWKSNGDNNGGTPGTSGWTEVPIYKTAAATDVSYAGSTNLAATNVEAALDELDAEKASTTHSHAGLYRGDYAAAVEGVTKTYDFADGTIPALFTISSNVAVAAYANVSGGAIPSPPANMVTLAGAGANSITRTMTASVASLAADAGKPVTKVRAWIAASSESPNDRMRFLVNGADIATRTSTGAGGAWLQVTTAALAAGDSLAWYYSKDGSFAAGSDTGYLARIEVLGNTGTYYYVNDLVTYQGALWKCATAGTSSAPGTNADWVLVTSRIRSINAQTGTAYTLAMTDVGKMVTLTNVGAITLTVPTNATVAFPVGAEIDLSQLGAGQVTIAGAAGVTVNGAPGLKIAAQYGAATLLKVATDTWLLVGKLAA